MNLFSLKISLRILSRYKVNTVINLLGLVAAFTSAILLLVYIFNEISYDNFHKNGDRIYRLNSTITTADAQEMRTVTSSGKLPAILLDKLPEIENITRFYGWGKSEVIVNHQRFSADNVFWVDTSYLKMFNFELLPGTNANSLNEPNGVLLTQTDAVKYFGDINPVGKTLNIEGTTYQVRGLMKDVPSNSHMQFGMLATMAAICTPGNDITDRNGLSFTFYVMLKEGANYDQFFSKFKKICNSYTEERFGSVGFHVDHYLQPLKDVHLHSNLSYDTAKAGDIKNIRIFGVLVLLTLLIASVNYINLMTAQSEIRMRETGLLKVLGADRMHLIRKFMSESLIICFSALIIAFAIAEVLLPPFGQLLDVNLKGVSPVNGTIIAIMAGVAFLTAFLSGIYPSLVGSVITPAIILKGSKSNSSFSNITKYLVAFQFCITAFLIIAVLLVQLQISYMKNKKLGFDRSNLIVLENVTMKMANSFPALRSELLKNPDIENVTTSQSVPGSPMSIQNCYKLGDDPKNAFLINEARVADNYLKTFRMNLIAGRDFDSLGKDDESFIVNEMAVKKLGLKNPLGEKIVVWNNTGTIVGVVSDFHFASMHRRVEPLVLTHYQKIHQLVTIRIRPGTTARSVDFIEKTVKAVDPDYNAEYYFIDEYFQTLYAKEERFNQLIGAGSILAIIISVMGLYAFTTFTIRRRVKEIGIRKTLGASIEQIVRMLSLRILWWMIPGIIVAFPFVWLIVSKWLERFSYHIELAKYWWVWIIGALVSITIGMLSVFFQSGRAAKANPVESLKYE